MSDEHISIWRAERTILSQVKFVNLVLEELRKRNKILSDDLGMTYGKLIGLGTPFEELIHHTRKVKVEFDDYLRILRGMILKEEKKRLDTKGKLRRRDNRFIEKNQEE